AHHACDYARVRISHHPAPRHFVAPNSEVVLDPELHDSRVADLRGDPPEVRGVEVRRRSAPVEVVQQVERLEPQLQPLRPDGNELRNRRNAVQHIKQMTVNQDALDAMNPPRRVRSAARDYTSALSVF